MFKVLYTLFVVLLFLSLESCYYDVEETLYPVNLNSCDTSGVTYQNTIKPIMDQNCVGCHTGASAGAGVELNTYEGTKKSGLDGSLYGSVSFNNNWSKMPKGGNQIDECSQLKIKTWVSLGCPNN